MSFPVVPSGLRSQARSSVTDVWVQTLLLPFFHSFFFLWTSFEILDHATASLGFKGAIKIQTVRTATKLSETKNNF